MEIKKTLVLALFVLSLPAAAAAQTAEEVNEANNPLTPKITVNLQDQYGGSYYGLRDSDSNTGLIRGVLPHKLFGWPQILRATMPIVTSPTQVRLPAWAISIYLMSSYLRQRDWSLASVRN
jgi:hypothetical protein